MVLIVLLEWRDSTKQKMRGGERRKGREEGEEY